MNTKEHKKHADLARIVYGNFNRNEWAIVGTQCNVIKSLADEVIKALAPLYKCAYVDAKHHNENESALLPQHLEAGAFATYTDHINYQQFNAKKEWNDFQLRQLLNEADMVLVNGNHFRAASQVVVIDETKKESLKKRLEQLTNIELILLADNAVDVFDFIKDVPAANKTPVYKLNETGRIIDFFKDKMREASPLLNGLVLAGGKSIRMGFDKANIRWYETEQQYYVADLLKEVCQSVFISCRPGQGNEINSSYKALEDTFTGLGPYGGILSAFRQEPNAAWLVVACDLPLLDSQTLVCLKTQRNVSSMATAFESPYNHFPEPLVAIWEPKSYPVLLSFLSQGYNCPGKALRNMDTTVINIPDPEKLANVNTPADFEKVRQVIAKKSPVHDVK